MKSDSSDQSDRSDLPAAAPIYPPQECQIECPGEGWVQDTDVLDTWFSSWLWAHETMDTPTRDKFYPTAVLVTGPDIIFFWVARMIMAGLEYEGAVPFREVYFTGIIRDKQGRKMSKSLGNSPDPLDIIAKFGADGLRFGLMRIAPSGHDIRFDENQIVEGRNFCNKLWNACRFRTMHGEVDTTADPQQHNLHIFSKDILFKLDACIEKIDAAYTDYRFSEVAQALYDFVWGDFCDRYIEAAKSGFLENADLARRAGALATFDYVISRVLRLLHPYTPFVTETLWQDLGFGKTIQFEPCPKKGGFAEEPRADALCTWTAAARNARATYNIPANKKLRWLISSDTPEWVLGEKSALSLMLTASDIEVVPTRPTELCAAIPSPQGTLYLPLEGHIVVETEIERLGGELKKAQAEIQKVQAKLASEKFTAHAPAEVVAEHCHRQTAWQDRAAALEAAIEGLKR